MIYEETPCKITLDILHLGCWGNQVRVMQILLEYEGFPCPDCERGKFGELTKDTLENFQMARGLVVDGVCGEKTWTKLIKGW